MVFDLKESSQREGAFAFTFTTAGLVTDEDYAKAGARIAAILKGVSEGRRLSESFATWDDPVVFES